MLTKPKKEEILDFKHPTTMDELLEAKLTPIIGLLNNHMEIAYKDFNIAMQKQSMQLQAVEKDLSHMVRMLWGITNESNARSAALERLLIKNGMNPSDLMAEITAVKDELKKTGLWQEIPLNEAVVDPKLVDLTPQTPGLNG